MRRLDVQAIAQLLALQRAGRQLVGAGVAREDPLHDALGRVQGAPLTLRNAADDAVKQRLGKGDQRRKGVHFLSILQRDMLRLTWVPTQIRLNRRIIPPISHLDRSRSGGWSPERML